MNLGAVDAAALGFDALAVSVNGLDRQAAYRNSGQLRLRRLDELAADATLSMPQAWMVQGLMPVGAFVVLYGTPKVGKTTLVAHLARCIAEGKLFLGRHVTRSPVLYFDLERAAQLTVARLLESGQPPSPSDVLVYNGTAPTIDQIEEALIETGARFVIIDTLQRFFGLDDENDASKATKALGPIAQMAHELGVTFLLTHHDRKAGGNNGTAMRGSNALLGVADVAIHMQRKGDGPDRMLQLVGNYDTETSPIVIRSDTSGGGRTYVSMPTVADDKCTKILAVLGEGELEADELASRLGYTRPAIIGDLATLERAGVITKRGTGRRGDPYVYSRTDSEKPSQTHTDTAFTETSLQHRSQATRLNAESLPNERIE